MLVATPAIVGSALVEIAELRAENARLSAEVVELSKKYALEYDSACRLRADVKELIAGIRSDMARMKEALDQPEKAKSAPLPSPWLEAGGELAPRLLRVHA